MSFFCLEHLAVEPHHFTGAACRIYAEGRIAWVGFTGRGHCRIRTSALPVLAWRYPRFLFGVTGTFVR